MFSCWKSTSTSEDEDSDDDENTKDMLMMKIWGRTRLGLLLKMMRMWGWWGCEADEDVRLMRLPPHPHFFGSSMCSTSLDSSTTLPLIMVWVTTFTIFLVRTSGSSVAMNTGGPGVKGHSHIRSLTFTLTPNKYFLKTLFIDRTVGEREGKNM